MPKRIFFPSIYRLGQLSLDGLAAWIACALAFLIRFEGDVSTGHQTLIWLLPLIAIPGRLLTHTCFGLYQRVWRFFGSKDIPPLVLSVTLYSLLMVVTTRLIVPRFWESRGVPMSVAVLDWSICLLMMMVLRLTRRWSVQRANLSQYPSCRKSEQRRLLLIGAGMAGCQIVQELQQNPQLPFAVVGFVDDDRTKIGRRVQGVKVWGPTHQFVAIARQLGVQEVLISMPSASSAQIRKLVNLAHGTSLKLKVLPGPAEILRDRRLAPQAREIQIQDILGRQEIELDFSQPLSARYPSAKAQIYQRRVLVTGAGGTIGSEICRQLARLEPSQILLLGRGENSIFNISRELQQTFPNLETIPVIADIRHQARLEKVFQTWKPEVVFHAAAHKHVPLMQLNPTEAIENNAIASARLGQLAQRHGVSTFVLISTDKAVDPSNFMGLSKRLAELLIKAIAQDSTTRFLAVRFGNVLGSRGSVVPIFQEQIRQGGPVTVTDPGMTRYFMTVPEAARLVIQSLAVGQSGQTLVLDMGEPVRIFDLAEQMIRLAGYDPGTDIAIHLTGLRPGEKLHEALVSDLEVALPTDHPKIMAVKSNFAPSEPVAAALQTLTEAAQSATSTEELWVRLQSYTRAMESAHLKTNQTC